MSLVSFGMTQKERQQLEEAERALAWQTWRKKYSPEEEQQLREALTEQARVDDEQKRLQEERETEARDARFAEYIADQKEAEERAPIAQSWERWRTRNMQ